MRPIRARTFLLRTAAKREYFGVEPVCNIKREVSLDYGEIINSAFRLSWKHKSLWIFGLFAFGMSFPSFNWGEKFDSSDFTLFGHQGVNGFDIQHFGPMILAVVGLIIALMVLFSIIANAISTPALVDAVNRITRGGQYRFKVSLKTGVHYMWRTLALMILAFFAVVLFLCVLGGIGVVMFLIALPLGFMSLLVLIPLLFVGIFLVTTIFNLAFRSIVVRDATVTDSLGEGIELLKRHPWPCVVMALIYIGLAIVVGIASMIVGLIILIPFIALAVMSTAGLLTALVVGFPVFWLVMLPISGFLGTAFEAMYTIFYFRLYEPPQQQVAPQSAGTV